MKRIVVAGSILVDKINAISAYPKAGELTKIKSVSLAVGGCVPNVAIDLAILGGNEISACGSVGKDAEGDFAINEMRRRGVNTEFVTAIENEKTSFTEVMSVTGGERTFFTYPGASANFGYDETPLEKMQADMLHLGYFLLLDKVDAGDGLRILKRAKELGIKTSIDLVSENSDKYKIVVPCLKYTDNLIVNEKEASAIAGEEYSRERLPDICRKLKEYGVKERVIVHTPELGACLSEDGYTEVPSFVLPAGYIKGSTGAGDAFCAGALCGIAEGMSDKELLTFSAAVAATSLSVENASDGIKSRIDTVEFMKILKTR